jgi:hypothetical protein
MNTIEAAAQAVGVAPEAVARAGVLRDVAPDLAAQVLAGGLTLIEAERANLRRQESHYRRLTDKQRAQEMLEGYENQLLRRRVALLGGSA